MSAGHRIHLANVRRCSRRGISKVGCNSARRKVDNKQPFDSQNWQETIIPFIFSFTDCKSLIDTKPLLIKMSRLFSNETGIPIPYCRCFLGFLTTQKHFPVAEITRPLQVIDRLVVVWNISSDWNFGVETSNHPYGLLVYTTHFWFTIGDGGSSCFTQHCTYYSNNPSIYLL